MFSLQIKNTTRRLLIISIFSGFLIGCGSIKKGAVVSGATLGAGAIAGAVTGGTAPAILAAGGSALVTSIGADLVMNTEVKGSEPMQCAPTNMFDILEALVTHASYWLLLIFVAPMVLGWILPGPLERRRRKKS